MRILIAASDNNKYSGAFRSMTKLAQHLQNDFGHEVKILLPYNGNGIDLLKENELEYDLIKSYDWVSTRRIVSRTRCKQILHYCSNIFVKKNIKEYLGNYDPDIVHINTSWCYIVGEVAESLGIPVIWHIREFLDEDQNMTYINKHKAIKTYSKAQSVVCISKAIQDKYLNFNLKNTRLIYNGIDGEIYKKDINREIMNNEFVNLIMIGGISENKGQLWVIESLIKMIDEKVLSPDKFCLHMVGVLNEDYVKDIKEKILKNNLSKCFDFAGPSNNVEEMLNKCDCFIMNSRCEAFGRVTVEAMMSGCLAIGCDTGGTPELIEHNKSGYIYKFKNYEDFKDVIMKAITDNKKSQLLAKQGQEIAFSKFDSLENAKQINELYIEVHQKHIDEKLAGGGKNKLILSPCFTNILSYKNGFYAGAF